MVIIWADCTGVAQREPHCRSTRPADETEDPRCPTIALVDDDRNILTSVSIALESEGYRIQTYTDVRLGPDVRAVASRSGLFSDIKIAAREGWNLLRRLRQKFRSAGDLLTSKDEDIDECSG